MYLPQDVHRIIPCNVSIVAFGASGVTGDVAWFEKKQA